MKKIFLFSLVICFQLLAQPDFKRDRDIIQSGRFFNSEIHFFPSNEQFIVFYSYKISYSQLFFEKKDDDFTAGININIEIKDTAGNTFQRAFDNRSISVKDFDLTNSPTIYLQSLIKFSLPEGKYNLIEIISDLTSKRERRLQPSELVLTKSDIILNPIVFEPSIINCGGSDSYVLLNSSAVIPFNKPNAYLGIPVTNIGTESLSYSIKRGDTLIVKEEKLIDAFLSDPDMKLCNNNIILPKISESNSIKIFLIKNISSDLTEGPIKLEIYSDEDTASKKVFDLNVIWIGKPLSLMDAEQAIRLLEIIEPADKVTDLLSLSDDSNKTLNNYWASKDPTPNTKYNGLMNEFYSRVDYCDKKFITISGNGGAKSDRGKTYIKYGAPDEVLRDTNSDDKVVETWIYKKSGRKYVFIDREGIGKFQFSDDK